ncbi:hypothetical protein GCM10009562_00540 [Nocardioides aquaticus]
MGTTGERLAPTLISVAVTVGCACGEESVFDELMLGAENTWPCSHCGRPLSVWVERPDVRCDGVRSTDR